MHMDKFTHDICKVPSKHRISFSSPSLLRFLPLPFWSDETVGLMTANTSLNLWESIQKLSL